MEGVIQYDIHPLGGSLATAFLALLNILFMRIKSIGDVSIYPKNFAEELLSNDSYKFDFIIVGGGVAGCMLAMKLTFFPCFTVLLLERGDYPSPSTDVPGLFMANRLSSQTFQHVFEPQERGCLGMVNERCVMTRGKALGGTSILSDMLFVRPLPFDIDRLAISYWNANITKHIYHQLECIKTRPGAKYQYNPPICRNGRVKLSEFLYDEPVKDILQEFYELSGYDAIPKMKFIGYVNHLSYVRDGVRLNAAKLFIAPIKERPNLFVCVNSNVRKVLIDNDYDKTTRGVLVNINNEDVEVFANKEVILTAGAINNVKLLLLSGIGPKHYLWKKKISVRAHSPFVGKNLQFHICVPIFYTMDPCGLKSNCSAPEYSETNFTKDVFDYIVYRKGYLATTGLHNFVLYINTEKLGLTQPNIAIYHQYFRIGDINLETVLNSLYFKQEIVKSLLRFNQNKIVLLFTVTLIHPLSRGEVLLNDTFHEGDPKVIPNFMTDISKWDYYTLMSGYQFLSNMMVHPFMQGYKFELIPVDVPNCRNYKICTVHYTKCYIHSMTYANSDVSGSTRMGQKRQVDAVVNIDMTVKGVRYLRVADTSIFPFIVTSNTVAADVLVGYRMGEILRQEWLPYYRSPFDLNETDPDYL